MADLTIAITNSVGVFGPATPDLWGAHNWGSFLWAEGTKDFTTLVGKSLVETVTLADAFGKVTGRSISNALTVTADMSSERLYGGGGYARLFPGGTAEGESRVASTWADGAGAQTSWSSATATSTSWSDA